MSCQNQVRCLRTEESPTQKGTGPREGTRETPQNRAEEVELGEVAEATWLTRDNHVRVDPLAFSILQMRKQARRC